MAKQMRHSWQKGQGTVMAKGTRHCQSKLDKTLIFVVYFTCFGTQGKQSSRLQITGQLSRRTLIYIYIYIYVHTYNITLGNMSCFSDIAVLAVKVVHVYYFLLHSVYDDGASICSWYIFKSNFWNL